MFEQEMIQFLRQGYVYEDIETEMELEIGMEMGLELPAVHSSCKLFNYPNSKSNA